MPRVRRRGHHLRDVVGVDIIDAVLCTPHWTPAQADALRAEEPIWFQMHRAEYAAWVEAGEPEPSIFRALTERA